MATILICGKSAINTTGLLIHNKASKTAYGHGQLTEVMGGKIKAIITIINN